MNNVGTVGLMYLKNVLQNYPPDLFVRDSNIFSIDEKRIAMDITNEMKESTRKYLSALSDLALHKDKYSRNRFASVKAWLLKIIEALDALQDMIRLCEDLSNVLKDEISWVRALAIQSMIDIIATAKREIGTLKDQARNTRRYSRIREKVLIIMPKRLTQVLEILFTVIAIDSGDLPSTAITLVIGQSIAGSETRRGAIR